MTDPVPGDDTALRLYLAVMRTIRVLRPVAAPVSPAGTSALVTLASAPDGMRIGELAEVERVSAPSATRLVASLEKDGLIERSPDPDDGRASVLRVTAAGKDAVEQGRGARIAELRRRLASVDPEDGAVRAAVELLEQLADLP